VRRGCCCRQLLLLPLELREVLTDIPLTHPHHLMLVDEAPQLALWS
jgi:hypothetical protein